MNSYQRAIKEMIKSVQYMIQEAVAKTTKCYDGLIVGQTENGQWQVKFNGETHVMKSYGSIVPSVGSIVKVIVPQGNMSIAFFI